MAMNGTFDNLYNRVEKVCKEYDTLKEQAKESGVELTQYASYAELAGIKKRMEKIMEEVNESVPDYWEYDEIACKAKPVISQIELELYSIINL